MAVNRFELDDLGLLAKGRTLKRGDLKHAATTTTTLPQKMGDSDAIR